MLKAIFSAQCPSCGAPVEVYSATAAVVVCQYCNSTLLRSQDSLTDSGQKSALIEDYSPLQLFSSGSFRGEHFTLIGRCQISYERGTWNEWYAMLDTGEYACLAEFSGLYVLSYADTNTDHTEFKSFEQYRIGDWVEYKGSRYVASDIRQASILKASAQGEIPGLPDKDQQIFVIDLRQQQQFMTLDFSLNKTEPAIYTGYAVELAELGMQNLRDSQLTQQSAGRLKGQIEASQCPSCGGSIRWVDGMTSHVVCPQCFSDISLKDKQQQVLKGYGFRRNQEQFFSLQLGASGTIDQLNWVVIGILKKVELDGPETWRLIQRSSASPDITGEFWIEYLLYNPQQGFKWLVENRDGTWAVATLLNQWPKLASNRQPFSSRDILMPKLYDYGSRVEYAAGAFYWHIESGDLTFHSDYGNQQRKLCAEYTSQELTWSNSENVLPQQVGEWFKHDGLKAQKRPAMANSFSSGQNRHVPLQLSTPSQSVAVLLLLAYGIINLPAAFLSLRDGFALMMVCLISYVVYRIVWYPFRKQDD